MSFLHPERLAFALFALLPLAFHLYQRFAMRRRVLPTLRFLVRHSAAETRHRRLRRYLLLACRILALLLAALAWARPVAREDVVRLSSAQAQLVIVVDRSLSMQAVVAGQSRFATAVAEARELVEHAPSGTLLTLIAFDTAPEIILEAAADPARVLESLRNLRPTLAGTNLAAGVQAARTTLLAHGGEGRLALLADLQHDGAEAALAGLLRGVAAHLVFSDRILAPTLENRGVGAMTLEAASGELRLTIRAAQGGASAGPAPRMAQFGPAAAGTGDTSRSSSTADAGHRAWRLTIPSLAWAREDAAENPVFILPRAAREAELLTLQIMLTGSDILTADDSCTILARLPRPLPVCLRAATAARPYLAASLEALGVRLSDDPQGSVLIGDAAAHAELVTNEPRGGLVFSDEPTEAAPAATAWSLKNDGPLAVPGLARARFTRRAVLAADSMTQPLMHFSDDAPAATEKRLPNGATLITFGFNADRASSDFVLTAAFPMLIRAALNRLGAGVVGEIVERVPTIPPEESNLKSRSAEEIAALLAPDASATRRGGRIANEPPLDRWTPLLLAAFLFLLLAEILLGRKA